MTPGPRTRALRPIARLWWTAVRRRWRQEAALLPILAGFGIFLGVFALGAPNGAGAVYVSMLLGLAMPIALLVPIAMRSEGVLASRRLELLPFTPPHLYLIRLIFDNPLRLALALLLAGWGAAAVLRLALPVGNTALELLQLFGWIIAGILLAQTLEDTLRRWNSGLAYEAVLMGGLTVSALLWPGLRALRAGRQGEQIPDGPWPAVLIGTRGPAGAEWLAAAAAWACAAVALLLGHRFAARHARPRAASRSMPALSLPIARIATRVVPGAPAQFGKELALVLRLAVLRAALVFLLLFAAAAFLAGVPPILLGIGLVWLGFSANLLGPDLPSGGITRYDLAAYPHAKVLAFRHGAIVLVALCAAAAIGAVFTLAGLVRPPEVGPASALAYPVAALYGASVFLLLTPVGDAYSRRFPAPVELRSAMPLRQGEGGMWPGILLFFAWGATALLAVGVFLLWTTMLGLLIPAAPDGGRLLAAVALSAVTHAALYFAKMRRQLRAAR